MPQGVSAVRGTRSVLHRRYRWWAAEPFAPAQLKVLWLTGTQVTDAGLESLTTLRNLEQLDVQATQVTPAAIEQLRKRLPQLDMTQSL